MSAGAQLAPVFNIGPRIVGQILGLPYDHYRPQSATNPLSVSNLLGSLPCWITADKTSMAQGPMSYGKPVMYGLFDITLTQVGDYLVGPMGTFFISSQDVPHPIQVVLCNHTIDIVEPAPVSGFGASGTYGGDQSATEVALATGWPCSMVQGTKGEVGATKLPSDVKMPWTSVLLPSIPGVILRNNFIMIDENDTRHIMSSTELSDLGWRLTAMLATT